eukprot:1227253-Rhodomonas_salina.1
MCIRDRLPTAPHPTSHPSPRPPPPPCHLDIISLQQLTKDVQQHLWHCQRPDWPPMVDMKVL